MVIWRESVEGVVEDFLVVEGSLLVERRGERKSSSCPEFFLG